MRQQYSKQREKLFDSGLKIEALDKLYRPEGNIGLKGNQIKFEV
jgi:hypothetical protein